MGVRKSFVREKKIFCGKEYIEMDLFEMADMRQRGRKERGRRSSSKQIKQNDKNAVVPHAGSGILGGKFILIAL